MVILHNVNLLPAILLSGVLLVASKATSESMPEPPPVEDLSAHDLEAPVIPDAPDLKEMPEPDPPTEASTSHDLETPPVPDDVKETPTSEKAESEEMEIEQVPEPAKQEAASPETAVPDPPSDELETPAQGNKPVEEATEPPAVKEPAEEPVKPEPVAQQPVQPTASSVPVGTAKTIKTLKGDSLWDTAARPEVYGDPELYPLLVDSNRKKLKAGTFVLSPRATLTIPRNVSSEKLEAARKNAWKPAYTQWRGRGLTSTAYQRWRYNHGLSSTWVEPADESQRGNLPRQ